jgi:UDP-N-acetylmuramyl tripeptide synthase
VGYVVLRVVVRGRPSYWRFTVYSWLLEVREILEQELGDVVEVACEDSDSEDPEVYLNGYLVGVGVPGEEGYLIELIKKAALDYGLARGSRSPRGAGGV